MQRAYFCPMCHAPRSGPKADCRECGWQARDIAAVRAAKRTAWDNVADGLELVQQGLRRQAAVLACFGMCGAVTFPLLAVLLGPWGLWGLVAGAALWAAIFVGRPMLGGLWTCARADIPRFAKAMAWTAFLGSAIGQIFPPAAGFGGLAFLAFIGCVGAHTNFKGLIGWAMAMALAAIAVLIFISPHLIAVEPILFHPASFFVLAPAAMKGFGWSVVYSPMVYDADFVASTGLAAFFITLLIATPCFYLVTALALAATDFGRGTRRMKFATAEIAVPPQAGEAWGTDDGDGDGDGRGPDAGELIAGLAAANVDGWEAVPDAVGESSGDSSGESPK